jgi:beta-N-acetylhexosaminidase
LIRRVLLLILLAGASFGQGAARRYLNSLTLREKVAQLIIVATYGEMPSRRSADYKNFTHWIRGLRVGGLIVVNRVAGGTVRNAEPYAMAAFLNRMQRMSKYPLLVGADFERGASMRVANTTKYPHMMAYGAAGDVSLTRALGAATAREARSLGIHWVFAPVADVNNNPDNPIINIRSFGADPEVVSAHVTAFIEGVHSDPRFPVLATAKHFPGHGDTAVDSHAGLAKITVDRARMEQVELRPFRAAIAKGVDTVMTAHIAVPALEEQEIPATVSRAVLTDLLRKEMGFRGIIATDAMDMQGLTNQFPEGEAAVRALEAGVDVLLMPPKPDAAIDAVLAAIRRKRLTVARIEESALKVINAKLRLGLFRDRVVNLDEIPEEIDTPEAAQQAQSAADRAAKVIKNDGGILPLGDPGRACYLALAENRFSQQGRKFLEEVARRAPGAPSFWLAPSLPKEELNAVVGLTSSCEAVVAAAFVTVAAYRGNVALAGNYTEMMNALLGTGKPVVMVALGSPYLIRTFPNVAGYAATYSTVPPSEEAAVKLLFGELK